MKKVNLIVFVLVIIVILMIIFNQINPIYPPNLIKLIFWLWLIPLITFGLSFLILRLIYGDDKKFVDLFEWTYYILPTGIVYKLVTEFYFDTQHIWSNVVLTFGTVMIFIILYVVAGIELFKVFRKKR